MFWQYVEKAMLAGSIVLAAITVMALEPGLVASQAETAEIDFELLEEGNLATIEPGIMIIADADSLASLYERLGKDPPSVDFGEKMVIGIFEGEQFRGGFDVEVKEVVALPEGLGLVVQEIIPGSACLTTQAISAPFEIVAVPKISEEIFFSVTPVVVECI